MTMSAVPAIPLVTEADVIAAFYAFYARPEELKHIEQARIIPAAWQTPELLAAFRRVLEKDRLRVIEQLTPSGS